MNKKKIVVSGIVVVIVGFSVAMGGASLLTRYRVENNVSFTDVHNPVLVQRGEYLARVSDCVGCHTVSGETPFSGGLAMQSPVGAIYSTNITPDKNQGIGNYTYADFRNAVKLGVRQDGTPLYPAMPFPSYRIIPDKDIEAMYAYFMTAVKPSNKVIPTPAIPWPLNMRWPMAWWQWLFAPDRQFKTPPGATAQVARGAYLVEGPEHCGACHTPRGLFFQEKALSMSGHNAYLSGAEMEGWYAKSLRGDTDGLANWSQSDIEVFLKTGRTKKSAAYGMMAPVIEYSGRFLSDDDITSIAMYLKSLPPFDGYHDEKVTKRPDTTTALLNNVNFQSDRGAIVYTEHCSVCHRKDGEGVARIFPALNGNTSVTTRNATSVIQITLGGGKMPRNDIDPMTFAMPSFSTLSDEDVAAVVSFIRQGWNNQAPGVTVGDVAGMRKLIHEKTHDITSDKSGKQQ